MTGSSERSAAHVECPDAVVCKTCPCAQEDDACFPGERLRAENILLRNSLAAMVDNWEADQPGLFALSIANARIVLGVTSS